MKSKFLAILITVFALASSVLADGGIVTLDGGIVTLVLALTGGIVT